MRADLAGGEQLERTITGASTGASEGTGAEPRTLRVEAVFRDVEEGNMHTIATGMIDCAHELANLPECACDVDVSVQLSSSDRSDVCPDLSR